MSQNLSVKTYLKVKFFKTGVHCKLFRITPALGGRGGNDFCRSGGKTDKFEIKTSLILFTLENLFISSQNSYKKNVPNIFFGGEGDKFLKREGEIIIFKENIHHLKKSNKYASFDAKGLNLKYHCCLLI